jgi:tripeptidyl-peptidase-1
LYGAHLGQEVIDSMIAPKDESRDLVMQWLNGEGLGEYASMSPRTDSVIVQASISRIEKLLKAEYSAFGKQIRNTASRPACLKLTLGIF